MFLHLPYKKVLDVKSEWIITSDGAIQVKIGCKEGFGISNASEIWNPFIP